jgi:hypothetical protein
MADTPDVKADAMLRQAGDLIGSRKESGNTPLDDTQKTMVQEATTTVIRELRRGRAVAEIEQDLRQAGWQPQVAGNFIVLVSRLLSKLYGVRTCLFAGLTCLSGMLASIIVSLAMHGEFTWFLAGAMVFIAVVCLLATVRNFQLWRRFRRM